MTKDIIKTDDHYEYWIDDGAEIRTCKECKLSFIRCPDDGYWALYLTLERFNFFCDRIDMKDLEKEYHCSLCDKYLLKEPSD